MIDREDLVFATCYQLAEIISSDWETQPEEVSKAIELLKPMDEPGEPYYGGPLDGVCPIRLTASETEPEVFRKSRKLIELKVVISLFKIIMKYSDGWQTEDSDTIQKEIVSRIVNYESQYKSLTTPVPFVSHITL
jgi:hypothetical protein